MQNLRVTAAEVYDDVGPIWTSAGAVIILSSIVLKTWTLLAFALGILLTLYLHPFESKTQRDHVKREWPGLPQHVLDEEAEWTEPLQVSQLLKSEMERFSAGIIKDYVKWWYVPPIFPVDDLFPNQCKSSLDYCLHSLYRSFSRKDPILYLDTIFTNTIATLGAVMEDLRLAHKLRTDDDQIGVAHIAMTRPESILNRMMNHEQQKESLQRCADLLLDRYARQADMKCLPAASFMRQVIAVSIFRTSLQGVAHRDTINTMILQSLQSKSTYRNETLPKDELSAVLDAATSEVALEAQNQTQQEVFASPAQSSAIEDECDVIPNTPEPIILPARPARGRRLSFKNKSVSSISDVFDDDGNRVTDKRKSFLQRTSSLLSKSRSRSTSPSKNQERQDSPPQSPLREHGRTRSISPFKKSTWHVATNDTSTSETPSQPGSTLFQAELIVNDASDISNSEYSKLVSALPKFSILISPTKQEGYTNTGGIGVFRSIRDLEALDLQIRNKFSEPLSNLPEWRKYTYAALENAILDYLVQITRSKVLAESEIFKQFCRSDVMSEESPERPALVVNPISDGTKAVLGSLRKDTALMQPTYLTPNQDPAKRTGEDSTVPSADNQIKQEEMKALIAAKELELENVAVAAIRRDESTKPDANQGDLRTCKQQASPSSPKAKSSTIDRSRIDLQNLVSQSMELITTFYALSSRTWTIRKQLLNVLRNLLLSKNSIYSQAFMNWLEDYVIHPLSDADSISAYVHQFNDFMFPTSYVKPEPLSSEQSIALATEARALFVQKGMPQAIRNLMGAPPTSEALGIVFDTLQNSDFSFGLMTLLFTETFRILMVD